jgi:hypothetical protein
MKKLITILCLLLSITVYGQRDTVVRKKYIDSLKYQLSLYSVLSYDHLNMYDKAETEKNRLKEKLNIANKNIQFLKDNRLKLKLITGLALLLTIITLVTMDSR